MRRWCRPSPVMHEPSPSSSIVGGATPWSFEKYVTQNAAFGSGTSIVSPRARLTCIAIAGTVGGVADERRHRLIDDDWNAGRRVADLDFRVRHAGAFLPNRRPLKGDDRSTGYRDGAAKLR